MYGTYQRLGVHIYASNREVIKAVRRKFKRSTWHDRAFREQRHYVYRKMIQYHLDDRNLAREFRL